MSFKRWARKNMGGSRVCAYLTSFTSFSPSSSCWETKSTKSEKYCCSSQGFTNRSSPLSSLVGESAFLFGRLSLCALFFSPFSSGHNLEDHIYPLGVTATLTFCPWSNSFKTSTSHVLVARQSEAPPRITNGRLRATYRINSRGDGISWSSSAVERLSSL